MLGDLETLLLMYMIQYMQNCVLDENKIIIVKEGCFFKGCVVLLGSGDLFAGGLAG